MKKTDGRSERGEGCRAILANGTQRSTTDHGRGQLREEASSAELPAPLPASGCNSEGRGWFSLRSVGFAQSPELRPSGVGTTRRLLGATPAPRNCETNPPFIDRIFVISDYAYMRCTRNERWESVGSFWKTNPPERGCAVGKHSARLVGLGLENEPNFRGFGPWRIGSAGRTRTSESSILGHFERNLY
jgi:hypothetical protein